MQHLGLFEYADSSTNPTLRKMFHKVGEFLGINLDSYDDSKLSWCGIFMTFIFIESGLKDFIPNKPLTARNWQKLTNHQDWEEISLKDAKSGDVVVFWRVCKNCWQGHVALFVNKRNERKIRVLGGNQDNGVTVRSYSSNRIIKIIRYNGGCQG